MKPTLKIDERERDTKWEKKRGRINCLLIFVQLGVAIEAALAVVAIVAVVAILVRAKEEENEDGVVLCSRR